MKPIFSAAIGLAVAWVTPVLADGDAPALIKQRTVRTELTEDGLFTRTMHVELRAANAAYALQVGQQSLPYKEGLEDLEIEEAYTLKASGEKVRVGPNAIYSQQSQGSAQFAQFDDQRQKVIVFPNVSAGDTVVYTARWHEKRALIPGQFTEVELFPRDVGYDDVDETIIAPTTFRLHIENHDVTFEQHTEGDSTVYHWRYSAPTSDPTDLPQISPLDSVPRFLVSSFKDFDEFGRTYVSIASPKASVTPKVQALADQITSGISDRRQQAEKIYDWVSKNIRYVAIDFADGGIVPHEADSVLENGYGDCKDHAVLFAALLKARNIESEPVLINFGNEYALPQVATIAPFNHVITWLPEFKLYVDTTAGVAPFGVLPFEEYGKPVVHSLIAGSTVRRVPILDSGRATLETKAVARIDPDGKLDGTSTISATGPFSITLRATGLAIQRTGPARFAAATLQNQGYPGTGGVDVPSPTDLTPNYTVQTNFSYPLKPEYMSGTRFDMARGIALMPVPGDFLAGPLSNEKLTEKDATRCFSGRMVEELRLEPPSGGQFGKQPANVSLRTKNFVFFTRWGSDGDAITLHREFESRVDKPFCDGALRSEAFKLLSDIRQHYLYDLISLTVAPPKGAQKLQLDAVSLLNAGIGIADKGDLNTAIRMYGLALASTVLGTDDDTKEKIYYARGYAYQQQGDTTRAVVDYTSAIRTKPTAQAYNRRGLIYARTQRWPEAIADLNEALKLDPDNAESLMELGYVYADQGLWSRAIDTCNASIRLAPSYAGCYGTLSAVYYALGDFQKSVINGAAAIKADGKYAFGYFSHGLSLYELQMYAEAAADFDKAVELAPMDAKSLFARGVAKLKDGKTEAGEEDIAAAKKIAPDVEFYMAGLGVTKSTFVHGVDDLQACKTASDVTQGLLFCTRVLTAQNLTSDDREAVHRVLGQMYFRTGALDEALSHSNEAISLNPGDVVAFATRSEVHFRMGDYDGSPADLNTAHNLDPKRPDILDLRAAVYAKTGQAASADADYDEAIRIAPDIPFVYWQRALWYEQKDRLDDAIKDLDSAIAREKDPQLFAARCLMLFYAGKMSQAMADCEAALLKAPKNETALAARGLIYFKLGDDLKAADDLGQAVQAQRKTALAFYGQGLLKLKTGDQSGNEDVAQAIKIDADLIARLRQRGLKP